VSVDPRNGKLSVLADNLPIGLAAPESSATPYTITDVAVDADGIVYMSSDIERTIHRITPRTGGDR
jgi:streptogramin lyase